MKLEDMTRREAMHLMVGTSAAVFGCCLSSIVAQDGAIKRPNILVIMSDDQGAGDIGFAGNQWAHTPVLDKLASESAQFTNFISAPACTPSRASYLTGRDFSHTGVWGVGPRGYIRRDETFLPEYLKRAGYQTAHFGKWGEGWTPDQRSYMRGYTEACALGGGYQHKDSWVDENGTLVHKEGWTTDLLADMTIDFIRKQTKANNSWYAITAYISPHSPWECDEKYSQPLEKAGYSKALAAFYGMVLQMDEATGRILKALDDLGQADNTVVIFVSDNGATPVCERTGGTPVGSEDWAKRNALDLRGQKAMVWENGIRVPMCVRWPAVIEPGVRGQFGAIEDMLPTILDLAGVDDSIVPDHLPLHGVSLKPVLFDAELPEKERYYFRLPVADEGAPQTYPKLIIEDPKTLKYERMHACLYGAKFKYHSLPGGRHCLYDMDIDPGEKTDVSEKHPEITRKMAGICRDEWDKLIASGRGFWMPPILIGDPRYAGMKRCWAHLPPDVVPCNAAQKVGGGVSCPFEGLRGFDKKGDWASFTLDVRTAGKYEVTMSGENLDKCSELTITVGGKELVSGEVTGKTIKFGTVGLSVEVMSLEILAKSDGQSAALIKEISILPVKGVG